MHLSAFAAAYAAVLLAEVAGDKTALSLGALASRYSPRAVLLGATPACALKMLAAVLLGHVIATMSRGAIRAISFGTFCVAAVMLLRPEAESREGPQPVRRTEQQAIGAAFATVFLTEWGDPGQLAAAALAAHSETQVAIWLGATCAILTKAAAATWLGARLARRVPHRVMRIVAVGVFTLFAVGTLITAWN